MKEKETDDEALFKRIDYMISWFHFGCSPDELAERAQELFIIRSNKVRDLIFNRIDRETT